MPAPNEEHVASNILKPVVLNLLGGFIYLFKFGEGFYPLIALLFDILSNRHFVFFLSSLIN